jgi:hypothetical protein
MNLKLFLATLAGAVGVVVAVHVSDFRGSVRNFERESGGGVLLDVRPAFSEDAVYARLDGYGAAGRSNYAFRNRTIDLLLPLSVLPFLMLLARRAASRGSLRDAAGALLLSFPIAYVLFDLAENALVLALLAQYPDRLTVAAVILPYVTVVKRGASLLAIVVPLAVLSYAALRSRRLVKAEAAPNMR